MVQLNTIIDLNDKERKVKADSATYTSATCCSNNKPVLTLYINIYEIEKH